jgi:phospholipase C
VPEDPIKHVIVLMLENHSFDKMLGALKADFPDLEGVDFDHPGVNLDWDGNEYRQHIGNTLRVKYDPLLETVNVLRQLDGDNGVTMRGGGRAAEPQNSEPVVNLEV